MPPLGYRVANHKLVVIDSEAEIVRLIFRRYAELGSVRSLKNELDACGVKSRSRTSASGRLWGSKPFSRGTLYLTLQNRIYRGEIVHKGQSHPGEHMPIIDQPLWDAVQAQLAGNAGERNWGARNRQPSLLAGMLFDGDGNRMTPSHAVKQGARYRYYVSRPLITRDHTEGSAGLRIPAGEIERLVTSRVRQWLLDPGSVYKATSERLSRSVSAAPAGRASRRDREDLARVAGNAPACLPYRADQNASTSGPIRSTSIFARHGSARSSMSPLRHCRARPTTKPRSCRCRYGCAALGGRSGC